MSIQSMENAPRFCLVVGLKLDDADGYAVEEAIRIAQRIPHCALHLVHALEHAPSEIETRDLVGYLRLYADDKLQSLGGLPGGTLGIHVRVGPVVTELARFAREMDADLVVVGAHAGHRFRWSHAKKAEELHRAAPCPVVVAGPEPRARKEEGAVIDPPCADCVAARAATNGQTFWCPRHSEHAKRAHTYSYQRQLPLRSHDAAVTPTGIDM